MHSVTYIPIFTPRRRVRVHWKTDFSTLDVKNSNVKKKAPKPSPPPQKKKPNPKQNPRKTVAKCPIKTCNSVSLKSKYSFIYSVFLYWGKASFYKKLVRTIECHTHDSNELVYN